MADKTEIGSRPVGFVRRFCAVFFLLCGIANALLVVGYAFDGRPWMALLYVGFAACGVASYAVLNGGIDAKEPR
jgi:3-mercaptopyruvate sulfurtransferase SseA